MNFYFRPSAAIFSRYPASFVSDRSWPDLSRRDQSRRSVSHILFQPYRSTAIRTGRIICASVFVSGHKHRFTSLPANVDEAIAGVRP